MGDFPEIHFHFHNSGDTAAVLAKLDTLEALMSDNSARFDSVDAALAQMKTSIASDVQHLLDIITQMSQTAVDNQALIDQLQADAAATGARVDSILASVQSVDADPNFPAVTPPVEPPTPPTEPLVPPIEPPAPEPTP